MHNIKSGEVHATHMLINSNELLWRIGIEVHVLFIADFWQKYRESKINKKVM
jgi:hypothetical protein